MNGVNNNKIYYHKNLIKNRVSPDDWLHLMEQITERKPKDRSYSEKVFFTICYYDAQIDNGGLQFFKNIQSLWHDQSLEVSINSVCKSLEEVKLNKISKFLAVALTKYMRNQSKMAVIEKWYSKKHYPLLRKTDRKQENVSFWIYYCLIDYANDHQDDFWIYRNMVSQIFVGDVSAIYLFLRRIYESKRIINSYYYWIFKRLSFSIGCKSNRIQGSGSVGIQR